MIKRIHNYPATMPVPAAEDVIFLDTDTSFATDMAFDDGDPGHIPYGELVMATDKTTIY